MKKTILRIIHFKLLIDNFALIPGCSAAWLARLVWDQEVASSNLAIPTIPYRFAPKVKSDREWTKSISL